MSANKRNDTKIPEDENVDSGFLSGPVCDFLSGEVQYESEELSSSLSSMPTNVQSDKTEQRIEPQEFDSGLIDDQFDSGAVDLCVSLSHVKISEASLSPEKFVYTVSSPEQSQLPPLVIFFQQDDDGDTQLHIASVHGCEKSVGTLIRVCPNKALLDVANDDGHTPLHLAVMSGNAVVTRMLVRAGLSLGVRDRIGETPLHKATAAGHVECLQALLAPVPEHPPRKLSTALNQKNYDGQACVHLAARAGHTEALQTLVFYGADINARENLAGWTALHIAARRGDARLVGALRGGAGSAGGWGAWGAAARARDFAGRTPRRLARRTPAASLFSAAPGDSDTESDSDDDMYDSDSESLFDRIRESLNPINVA